MKNIFTVVLFALLLITALSCNLLGGGTGDPAELAPDIGPIGLRADLTGDNAFTLSWSWSGGDISGFRIYEGQPDGIPEGATDADIFSITSETLNFSGESRVETSYSVVAWNAGGESPSATITLTPLGSFITHWQTDNSGTSDDNQITLPLVPNGVYDFTIDWGDGNSDIISVWNQDEVTHTYAAPGDYEVEIFGLIEGWSFNNGGDAQKLLEVRQWGALSFGDTSGQFHGAQNMVISASDSPDLSNTTSLANAFNNARALTNPNGLETWDTSTITSLFRTFRDAVLLNTNSLNAWDVSSVSTMAGTFRNTFAFNGDLSDWDTSSVESMWGMFQNALIFNRDIGGWNTANVLTMENMFAGMGVAGTQQHMFNRNIGTWDVTSVTTMDGMFSFNYGMNEQNWSATVIGWESQAVQNNVPITAPAGNPLSAAAIEARDRLISDHSWTF